MTSKVNTSRLFITWFYKNYEWQLQRRIYKTEQEKTENDFEFIVINISFINKKSFCINNSSNKRLTDITNVLFLTMFYSLRKITMTHELVRNITCFSLANKNKPCEPMGNPLKAII